MPYVDLPTSPKLPATDEKNTMLPPSFERLPILMHSGKALHKPRQRVLRGKDRIGYIDNGFKECQIEEGLIKCAHTP